MFQLFLVQISRVIIHLKDAIGPDDIERQKSIVEVILASSDDRHGDSDRGEVKVKLGKITRGVIPD